MVARRSYCLAGVSVVTYPLCRGSLSLSLLERAKKKKSHKRCSKRHYCCWLQHTTPLGKRILSGKCFSTAYTGIEYLDTRIITLSAGTISLQKSILILTLQETRVIMFKRNFCYFPFFFCYFL